MHPSKPFHRALSALTMLLFFGAAAHASAATSAIASAAVPTLNLMPVPASITVHDGKLRLTKDFNLSYSGPASARLQAYGTRFLRRLDGRTGLFFSPAGVAPQAALQIHATAAGRLALDGDESYTLEINAQQVRLDAATDIGAMRGV